MSEFNDPELQQLYTLLRSAEKRMADQRSNKAVTLQTFKAATLQTFAKQAQDMAKEFASRG